MTENIENKIIIENKVLRDLILQELRIRKENTQLKKDNQVLSDELAYFKELCADLEDENLKRIEESNRLFCELDDIKSMSMFEFADKYCTNDQLEEAGHAFARSLGVGVHPQTHEELAIEKHENCYKPYVGDDF